jgi:hypothetical protein
MSKTVGHGSQYAIDLDEPLSAEDRQYLQDRDPTYRDALRGEPTGGEEVPPYEQWDTEHYARS